MAPTNLINLEQGSISFGIRQVLDSVSLGLSLIHISEPTRPY